MLKAILQGKAGKITLENGENIGWRDVFKLREDLLTAVFFSRIRYLSSDGELSVLSLLIGIDDAQQLGEINEYIYWPKLTGLEGRSYVEPDVMITCENALILVEVKPPFGGSQYSAQWRNEIESLIIQEEDDDSEWDELPDIIHFVALGNNAKSWQSDASALQEEYSEYGLRVHIREWEQINNGISKLFNIEEGRDSSVYSDWIDAFTLFGLVDRSMNFSDMVGSMGTINDSCQSLFMKWPQKSEEYDELDKLTSEENVSELYKLCKLASQYDLRIESWI